MTKSSRKSGLGNTLNRAHRVVIKRRSVRKSDRHAVEPLQDSGPVNLKSVTDQTNLSEFLEEAELAGKTFLTERRNLELLATFVEEEEKSNAKLTPKQNIQVLRIPRRPDWNDTTTPGELDVLERNSFLEWRRNIATVDAVMTPFEKNIEVWRQLWRVIERSNIVVQILDSRNPLLYLCDDLIEYVKEHKTKLNLLLLNKADYLTLAQRKYWAKYFKSKGIEALFFSALFEKGTSLKQHQNIINEDNENEIASLVEDRLSLYESETKEDNIDYRIYNKFELLDKWKQIYTEMKVDKKLIDGEECSESDDKRIITIGLVGYPNVGKSSTINALLAAKRVAVSATPGKTKHFQTFLVDANMILCDCPGLVFPNFVSGRDEMVVNGVLPIDQMKDHIGPVRIIVDRIPKKYFEKIYGLAFENNANQNLSAEDLLNSYAFMRGYMTARGLPDVSRAARKICKDYLEGKLLFCESPPDVVKSIYQSKSKLAEVMKRINEQCNEHALRITERQRRLMAQAKGVALPKKEIMINQSVISMPQAHVKGPICIGNASRPACNEAELDLPRREKKHKKREKLRRVYRYLDE